MRLRRCSMSDLCIAFFRCRAGLSSSNGEARLTASINNSRLFCLPSMPPDHHARYLEVLGAASSLYGGDRDAALAGCHDQLQRLAARLLLPWSQPGWEQMRSSS